MRRSGYRIAFVDANHYAFYGAQRSLFTLVKNLSKRIHPIVLLPSEGVLADTFRDAGIDVCVLPLGETANLFGGKIFLLSLMEQIGVGAELIRYNLRVARWLKQANIDVIYANDFRSLTYVGIAGKLVRKPVLWYVRADGLPISYARIGLRLATRVILIANGVRSIFHPHDLRRYEHKFATLYTGFELRESPSSRDRCLLRKRLGIPRNTPVVGIVGSITHRKGQDLLIQAMAHLSSMGVNAHLVIVGDSPVGHEAYKQDLDYLITQLGISDRIHWLGYQDDVTPFYELMDVLALPSRSEGLPRVVIEGLFAGVPVVASDVGGVKEIIASDTLGRVIPPDDVNALTGALVETLRDSRLHSNEVRGLRRQYVRDRFGLEAYVRGFESIIDTLGDER